MSFKVQIDYVKQSARSSHLDFDGVIDNACLLRGVFGAVYGSDHYKDGEEIETSRIAKLGELLSVGKYVETINGHRYAIVAWERPETADFYWDSKKQQINSPGYGR